MQQILIITALSLAIVPHAQGQIRTNKVSNSFESAPSGVRIEFAESNLSTVPKQPGRHGQWTGALEIDGLRFRILKDGQVYETETSLDNGATTFFWDPTKTHTPLATITSGHMGPFIHTWIENEKLTVGAPHAGPMIAGIATQTYSVDCTYESVTSLVGITYARSSVSEHYELSVGDIGVSPAAVRVLLSHGYGMTLTRHPEAFRGFPLRIDGHNGTAPNATTDFRLEASSLTRWSWPNTVN